MASRNQKQVLLGLESGRKLDDLLREPGMPSKKMLDEWRDDPTFEEAYQAALTKGGHPAPKHVMPPPFFKQTKAITDLSGNGEVPTQFIVQETPPVAAQPAPTPALASSKRGEFSADKATHQAHIIALRKEGMKMPELLKQPGVNSRKLEQYRQEPEFRRLWDESGRIRVPKPAPGQPVPDQLQQELTEARAQVEHLQAEVRGHEEYQADIKRLTRELDVALFGEENAAQQASLCDLVRPASKLVSQLQQESASYQAKAVALQQFKDYVHGRLDAAGIDKCEEQNALNGCRIGARLDAVLAQLEAKSVTGPACDLTPAHPGLALARILKETGTAQVKLAAALQIQPTQLNEILKGKRPIHTALCVRLEALCWGVAEHWAQRQSYYDLYHERQKLAA